MIAWVSAALWGGLVGLDATSFPQAMISRPLVAATITGLIVGRPVEALVIGVMLEAFALVVLPIGAARYPESGTAAVAGTGAYLAAAGPGPDAGALLMAVVFALAWERVGGASVNLLRRFNERLVAVQDLPPDRAGVLERRHLMAMALDFIRGGIVAGTGALAGALLIRVLAPLWTFDSAATLAFLAAGATIMLGAVLPLFGGWSERRAAFVLGILCGSVMLLIR